MNETVKKIHDPGLELNWRQVQDLRAFEEKVYTYLESLKIKFLSFHHTSAPTVEHVAALEDRLEGKHCKNLFVRNSRADQHYLVIAPHDKALDMKLVARAIPSTRLSFAQPEVLFEMLSLTPGSVTPFGLINDPNKQVKVILDEDLCDFDAICFHPGHDEATTTITLEGLETFLKATGHDYQYMSVPPRTDKND